ncbi:histidine--tRNA ligase, cytoplasmic-like [Zophobas morio]|uniref:histidine--tRNA ligase, cytoplasmic-like n=1 Tax=Zophobas morio TaxID=2755281 RepID=UPI003083052B
MYTSKAELLQQLEEWELKHKELLEKEEDNEVILARQKIQSIKETLTSNKTKKIVAKVPKGMKDNLPREMAVREKVFKLIIEVFKRHGAVAIDTPVMELKEILVDKYGEESKLIYDVADQGGELCALRYDLTVPFARFVATHKIDNIKRYHIAKVYRRDQPAIERGRFREFYQCDFDIAGIYDPLLPDADCLRVVYEIMQSLELGDFIIKINHRKILNGLFEYCGVPAAQFRTICSSIDKLDKSSWEAVRKEMIEVKGIPACMADQIGEFINYREKDLDCHQLLYTLSCTLGNTDTAKSGILEIKMLFDYLQCFGVMDRISFDLSLARGLDYYTGVIFETIFTDALVGSVAGGGRYDDLVGRFSKNGRKVPCVGVSIGVERIFTLMEAKLFKLDAEKIISRENETEVYVASTHGCVEERLKIVAELWDAGIKTEFMYKNQPKLLRQFQHCEDLRVPLCVIIGPAELEEGQIIIRDVFLRRDEKVNRSELTSRILAKLNKL